MLYAFLHRKGHFRLTGQVAGRIARIIVAAAAMAAALHYAIPLAGDAFIGGVFERIVALTTLFGARAMAGHDGLTFNFWTNAWMLEIGRASWRERGCQYV